MKRGFISAMVLLLFPTGAHAVSAIVPEGVARMDVLLAMDRIVVCRMIVSGAEPQLVAYDSRKQTVAWRRPSKISSWLFAANADANPGFIVVEGSVVSALDVRTGETVWQTDLGKVGNIAAATNTAVSSADLVPDSCVYVCERPLLTRTRVAVARTEMRRDINAIDGGQFPYRRGWVLLDRFTGEPVKTDPGFLVGRAGETILVAPPDNVHLLGIEADRTVDLTGVLSGLSAAWRFDPLWVMNQWWSSASEDDTCLFRVRVDEITRPLLYTRGDDKVRVVRSTGRKHLDMARWAFSGRGMVRYGDDRGPSNRVYFIELYAKDGSFVAGRDFKNPGSDVQFQVLGASTKGQPVLASYRTEWETNVLASRIASARIEVLDKRTLATEKTIDLSADLSKDSTVSLYLPPGSSIVLQSLGNRAVYKMREDSIPHELSLRAMDLSSGKEKWRIAEPVTIRKRAGGLLPDD